MSFREKIFIDQLAKNARVSLARLLNKRRSTLWGETPVLLRVRKYKVAGEVRNMQVTVVKPNLNKVRLYSPLLGRFVNVEVTPQMLRYIEALGGLDDYLLKTPDDKLMSDVASGLKCQLLAIKQHQALGKGLEEARQLCRIEKQDSNQRLQAGAPSRLADKVQGQLISSQLETAQQQQEQQSRLDSQSSRAAEEAAKKRKEFKDLQEKLASERRTRITQMLQAAAAFEKSSSTAGKASGMQLMR